MLLFNKFFSKQFLCFFKFIFPYMTLSNVFVTILCLVTLPDKWINWWKSKFKCVHLWCKKYAWQIKLERRNFFENEMHIHLFLFLFFSLYLSSYDWDAIFVILLFFLCQNIFCMLLLVCPAFDVWWSSAIKMKAGLFNWQMVMEKHVQTYEALMKN